MESQMPIKEMNRRVAEDTATVAEEVDEAQFVTVRKRIMVPAHPGEVEDRHTFFLKEPR